MTITVDNIIKLLGETQLKYRRLHFEDYARELAPRPYTVSNRIQLPSFFRTLFDDGVNLTVHSVSGKIFSFWHALLYCVYPNYIDMSWYDRKKLIDRFIDELNHDVQSYFMRDEIIKTTNMDHADVRFHDPLPSDQLIYYISSRFQINIILCDNTRIFFYFPGISFDKTMPIIMLYLDDRPTFHVITIDDRMVTTYHDQSVMSIMYRNIPEVNRVLREHTSKLKVENDGAGIKRTVNIHFAKVNKLSPEDSFKIETQPKLASMRLTELQVLAEKYGLSIEKEGKTKKVKKAKKDLIEDIVNHLTSS